MPIYEYRCIECGEEFEAFVRLSQARVEIKCPHCQSKEVRKTFSIFGTGGVSTTAATSGANCAPVG